MRSISRIGQPRSAAAKPSAGTNPQLGGSNAAGTVQTVVGLGAPSGAASPPAADLIAGRPAPASALPIVLVRRS